MGTNASDRTQYKQALLGTMGDSRTVANAKLMVAQDAQRFASVCLVSGLANNVSPNLQMERFERPVQVKECRILPGAALTNDTGNLVLSYGYTNDGGGAFTTMGSINTNASGASGGTGTWAAYVSIVITANTLVNAVVPSGSHFGFKVVNNATGLAIPAGTSLQVLWEEV